MIIERFKAEEGDVLMMIADLSRDTVNKVLCSLRIHVAERLGLVPENRFCPLWITEFPLLELKEGELNSHHHPFTMPDRTDFDPADKRGMLTLNSRAYDLVINGEELGGGSIRIHDTEIQKKMFQALGLSRKETDLKFGFFLKALEYGAPPHGGIALGMDRVIAMILRTPSIREVIAFPKNRRAFCPLTRAPSWPDGSQLMELGLASGFQGEREMARSGKLSRADLPGLAFGDTEKITRDEVTHVAKLARLKLAESEVRAYQKDLNAVLGHFETLQELDTENARPMSHVLKLKNVWREDKSGKSKKTDPLLSNAPTREKNYFKVPKILEGQ
jgi:aspartyl-tRNA synthetase